MYANDRYHAKSSSSAVHGTVFSFPKAHFSCSNNLPSAFVVSKINQKKREYRKTMKKTTIYWFPIDIQKTILPSLSFSKYKRFFFFFFYLGLIWNSLIPLYFRFFWLIVASLSTNSSPSSFDASSLSSLKNYFSSLIAVHFVVFLLILPAEGCMFSGNSVWKNLWN